jgi:outer membrane autotransporter protein
LTPVLSYDADDVFLTLTRNGFTFSSLATNHAGVAGALDQGPQNGALVNALLVQNDATIRQAFDALSGEVFATLDERMASQSFLLREIILGRLRQAGYAGAPGALGALSFGGPDLVASEDEPALAFASGSANKAIPVKAAPAAPPASGAGRDLTFWGYGFGGWGRADSDGIAAAVRDHTEGFVTGFDARFGFGRFGIVGGYSHSGLNVDARSSSASLESGHLGAYAGTQWGPLNLRAGATWSFHSIDTDRTIFFPGFLETAKAHFNGSTGQVFGEAGYGLTLAGLRSSRSRGWPGSMWRPVRSSKTAAWRRFPSAAPTMTWAIPRWGRALPRSCRWRTAWRSRRARALPGSMPSAT